jgi:hypothetical protein
MLKPIAIVACLVFTSVSDAQTVETQQTVVTDAKSLATEKSGPLFDVHDGLRNVCFRTLIDGVQLDHFGNLVIHRRYFRPIAEIRESVKPERIDIGITTRPLLHDIGAPLVITAAIRVRKQDDSKNSVLIRLGDIELGRQEKSEDYAIEVESFNEFLDLGAPVNNRYRKICIDVGYFYNNIGDAYCDTFHAVAKGCSE